MSTTGWVVLGIIVVLVVWAISIYNNLVAMRQRTNQAFADMFSSSEDALRQRPFSTLIHPDDRRSYPDEMRALFTNSHMTTEKRYLRDDGTSFWGLLHAAMVPDRHGGPGRARQPGRRHRPGARRDAVPGGAGLAAAEVAGDPAHPGHQVRRPPDREHGCGRSHAVGRGHVPPGRPGLSQDAVSRGPG